jgi:hypothetical protein
LNFDIPFAPVTSVYSVAKILEIKKAVRRNPTAQNKKAVGSIWSAHGLVQLNLSTDQLPGGGQTSA